MGRLLEAAGGDADLSDAGAATPGPPARRAPSASATGRWSSCLYAAGLRVSERSGSTSAARAWTRPGPRHRQGDHERVVPIGEVAVDWLARYLAWPRGEWVEAGVPDGATAPCS